MEQNVAARRAPVVLRARWRGTLIAIACVVIWQLIFTFCDRPFEPWASRLLYLTFALGFFGGVLSMVDTLGSYRRARDLADATDPENEVPPK